MRLKLLTRPINFNHFVKIKVRFINRGRDFQHSISLESIHHSYLLTVTELFQKKIK